MGSFTVIDFSAMVRWWRRIITGKRMIPVPVTLGIVVALVLTIMPGAASPSYALTEQCILTIMTGEVNVVFSGSGQAQPGSNGMILKAGDRIRTGAGSSALLTFFDGSTLELGADTEVEIERLERDKHQTITIVLKQWVGKTWSHVIKMADAGSHYEIKTPAAVALVRGTRFMTEVDNIGATRVLTAEGLVSVSAEGEEIFLPPGEETRVAPGMPPSEPQPQEIYDEITSLRKGTGAKLEALALNEKPVVAPAVNHEVYHEKVAENLPAISNSPAASVFVPAPAVVAVTPEVTLDTRGSSRSQDRGADGEDISRNSEGHGEKAKSFEPPGSENKDRANLGKDWQRSEGDTFSTRAADLFRGRNNEVSRDRDNDILRGRANDVFQNRADDVSHDRAAGLFRGRDGEPSRDRGTDVLLSRADEVLRDRASEVSQEQVQSGSSHDSVRAEPVGLMVTSAGPFGGRHIQLSIGGGDMESGPGQRHVDRSDHGGIRALSPVPGGDRLNNNAERF